jgi:hypothetical protein
LVWRVETLAQQRQGAHVALRTIVGRPFSFATSVARRALALAGPDTFGLARLLPSYTPTLGTTTRLSLRVTAPLLVVLAGAGSVLERGAPVAVLVGMQWLVIASFHTRTRFRATLLPGLTALAALGLEALSAGRSAAIFGAGGAALLVVASTRIDLERDSAQGEPLSRP